MRAWAGWICLLALCAACAAQETVQAQPSAEIARLVQEGNALIGQHRPKEALELIRRALALSEAKLGAAHDQSDALLYGVAKLCENLGLDDEAAAAYATRVERLKDHEDEIKRADAQNDLGAILFNLGRYDEAGKYFESALEIRERKLGADHEKVALSLNNLAGIHWKCGRQDRAAELLARAIRINEKRLGPEHLDLSLAFDNLGVLRKNLGQFERARELLERALAIRKKHLGTNDWRVGLSQISLGDLAWRQGDYREAERLTRAGLETYGKTLGDDHPKTLGAERILAKILGAVSRFDEAEALFKKVLAAEEQALGAVHPNLTQTLTEFGYLYDRHLDHEKAEPLFKRAIELTAKHLGADHPDLIDLWNNLGACCKAQGRIRESEAAYRSALKLAEARATPDEHLFPPLNNLGVLLLDAGEYGKAEPLLQRGLDLCRQVYGEHHLHLANVYFNQAALFAAQGRWDLARTAKDRDLRIKVGHARRLLPALTEREQLVFLALELMKSKFTAITLVGLRSGDPGLAEQGYAWLLNTKGLSAEVLSVRARLERVAQDPKRQADAARLKELRETLARQGGQAVQGEARHKLEAEITGVERKLGLSLIQAADDGWHSAAEVRRALPQASVLVDLIRYEPFMFKKTGQESKWGPPRYAAFVVAPEEKGSIRMLDLGACEPIDALIASFHEGMDASGRADAPGAQPESSKILADLGGRIWQPIEKALGGAEQVEHIWISPDGELWRVPWAALPDAEGRPLVERLAVSHLVTARNLLEQNRPPAEGAAVMVADPDFDLSPEQMKLEPRRVLGTWQQEGGLLAQLGAPVGDATAWRGWAGMAEWKRLPGTAKEAGVVAPLLKRLTGKAARVCSGAQALEEVVKRVKRPRLLVLSTHGFFLPPPSSPASVSGEAEEFRGLAGIQSGVGQVGAASGNPLLRCGLVLAGANKAHDAETAEDGILTALEILNLDLEGSELVVLNACETARGGNGNGVASLRQAFQLAGARAVVATLWRIPDRETVQLTQGFFEALAAGADHAQALRKAQLQVIATLRKERQAAPSYFWAAFTVTGR